MASVDSRIQLALALSTKSAMVGWRRNVIHHSPSTRAVGVCWPEKRIVALCTVLFPPMRFDV